MQCTMRDPDGPGDRQARRSKAKEKAPEATVEAQASKKRNIATAARLPAPMPVQLPRPDQAGEAAQSPGELTQHPLRVGHDCAGMNATCQALRNLRVDFAEVFASDTDKFACQTIDANFRPIKFYREVDGDITKRDNSQAPGCDLYMAGFPCQPHSMEGNKRGFEDSCGQVFYGVLEYLKVHKPRAVVLENVRGLVHNRRGKYICEVLHQLLRID